jgi:hypothetical protein
MDYSIELNRSGVKDSEKYTSTETLRSGLVLEWKPNRKVNNIRTLKKAWGGHAAVILAALLAITTGEALALSRQATDFLLSISIDPASDDVKLADQDGIIETGYVVGPKEFSLESLAIAKNANGVKCFINMRVFIRGLKADPGHTAKVGPGHPLYNCALADYLTMEEKILVLKLEPFVIIQRR